METERRRIDEAGRYLTLTENPECENSPAGKRPVTRFSPSFKARRSPFVRTDGPPIHSSPSDIRERTEDRLRRGAESAAMRGCDSSARSRAGYRRCRQRQNPNAYLSGRLLDRERDFS